MILQVLLLALGFLMLVKGADWFVDGASGIAERFGIPQLVVGLTIVAMGTSMPEAAVSINSALKGNAGITIGNIVGSNILNILIILGITAVITTVAVQKSTIWIEIPYMLVITVLLLVLGKSGNQITFSEGVILWVVFLLYLGYLFYCAKKNKEEVIAEEAKPMWKLLLATVLGLLLVVWGSDVTVDAATAIARVLGISERVIGLTVVALGTSLPELFTSVSAATEGKSRYCDRKYRRKQYFQYFVRGRYVSADCSGGVSPGIWYRYGDSAGSRASVMGLYLEKTGTDQAGGYCDADSLSGLFYISDVVF